MQADFNTGFNTGRYKNPGVTDFPAGMGNAVSNPDGPTSNCVDYGIPASKGAASRCG
jgi:hypothetical protein